MIILLFIFLGLIALVMLIWYSIDTFYQIHILEKTMHDLRKIAGGFVTPASKKAITQRIAAGICISTTILPMLLWSGVWPVFVSGYNTLFLLAFSPIFAIMVVMSVLLLALAKRTQLFLQVTQATQIIEQEKAT